MKRIIYPTDDGGVSIVIPAPECGLTIEEIATRMFLKANPTRSLMSLTFQQTAHFVTHGSTQRDYHQH
jgi:hypothetical protein